MYSFLLYLHILSAIGSIGPFFVLFSYIPKMKHADVGELHSYLDSFSFVVRLSKHSGHVLVLSGVLLMWHGGWTILTSWIALSIAILFSALFFIVRAFTPILRKLKDPQVPIKDLLIKKLFRSLTMYVIILLILMWFMVAKPSFW